MEPRVRVGVMAGIVPAVAAFLLSFVTFCLGGLFAAPLAGYNAGTRIGRDQNYARQSGTSGALAGLAAGGITACGQFLGMILTTMVFQDQLRMQLAANPVYAPDLFWPSVIISSLIIVTVEVGLAVGAGALGANATAQRMYAMPTFPRQNMPMGTPSSTYTPPSYVPSQPLEDASPPLVRPSTPPPDYPPPPSYYGKPDTTTHETPSGSDDVPPQTDAM